VSVGLVTQDVKAHASCFIFVCGLSGSTMFFPHYLMNGTIFGAKKIQWTQNVCFDFLYNFRLKHFSF
jgi:hypothetical protein